MANPTKFSPIKKKKILLEIGLFPQILWRSLAQYFFSLGASKRDLIKMAQMAQLDRPCTKHFRTHFARVHPMPLTLCRYACSPSTMKCNEPVLGAERPTEEGDVAVKTAARHNSQFLDAVQTIVHETSVYYSCHCDSWLKAKILVHCGKNAACLH